MNTEDIKLRKIGEPEFNSLPRGVRAITFNGRVVFCRRTAGRFMPVPADEQARLEEKHVIS